MIQTSAVRWQGDGGTPPNGRNSPGCCPVQTIEQRHGSDVKPYPLNALVGLEPAEATFYDREAFEAVLPGFGDASDDGCWLPEKARDALHLHLKGIGSTSPDLA